MKNSREKQGVMTNALVTGVERRWTAQRMKPLNQ